MVRKRIPLVTRPDTAYAASLPDREELEVCSTLPTKSIAQEESERGKGAPGLAAERPENDTSPPHAVSFPHRERSEDHATQVDIRVTSLARQEAELLACGIDPRQVIRAALRNAVKGWTLSPDYVPPLDQRRAKHATWTARTSLAVPAAVFDRLQVERDPLGVCSRWSLVRGQVEPLVWDEIDALLATLRGEARSD